ncbi:MAG: SIMPL domain-containing protein [Flavobacteriia bacterium]|nr:SIMPL domain-containing protein [Flavobacteriia bacterium]
MKTLATIGLALVSALTFAQEDGITVTGTVSREVEPDEMVISFGISTLEDDVKSAFSGTEAKAESIISYLEGLGEICEVETEHVQVSEQSQYRNGEQIRLGFRAVQYMTIRLNDFDKYPDVMSELIDLGVEHIGGVRFVYSKAQQLKNEMRVEAIMVARKKAEEIAGALGVGLGSAEMYFEPQGSYDVSWKLSNVAYESTGNSSGPSVAPGKQTIQMEVQVRFAILAPEE